MRTKYIWLIGSIALITIIVLIIGTQNKSPVIPPEVKKEIEKLYLEDYIKRIVAINELKEMGKKATPAIPYLVEILGDTTTVFDVPAVSIGCQAAVAIGKLGERGFEVLIGALKNRDPNVRLHVVIALGILKDRRAMKYLTTALGDEDAEVRRCAAITADEIDKKAFTGLIANLKDKNIDARIPAIKVLGKIKYAPAVEPLIAILNDQDSRVKIAAIEALGAIGDAQAIEPLVVVLKNDKNPNIRKEAVVAIGNIKDARIIQPLIYSLKDKDIVVGVIALSSLKDITGQDFSLDSEKWWEWWEKNKGSFANKN